MLSGDRAFEGDLKEVQKFKLPERILINGMFFRSSVQK